MCHQAIPQGMIKRALHRGKENAFEVVMGTQIENYGTRLCNIDVSGEIHDEINYKIIGSSSGSVSYIFSEKWNKNMNMEQTAVIGFTAVNCVIKNNQDDGMPVSTAKAPTTLCFLLLSSRPYYN